MFSLYLYGVNLLLISEDPLNPKNSFLHYLKDQDILIQGGYQNTKYILFKKNNPENI